MNDHTEWYEISIFLPVDAVDDVSAQLSDAFYGRSLVLELSADQAMSGKAILRGYVQAGKGARDRIATVERALWHLQQTGEPIDYAIRTTTAQEWLATWKSFYKPLYIGQICIVPAWEVGPLEVPLKISIDPGMAFGTGLHPTTQLCLLLLQEVPIKGAMCLDLGTGSGILAIAAALLGASRVLALDLDPVAVAAARDNVARNGVEHLVQVAQGTLPVAETFDTVMANISSGYFVKNARLLRQATKTGGKAIVSGTTAEQVDQVLIALTAAGFRAARLEQKNDWIAIVATAE